MASRRKNLLREALQLSEGERAELAGRILQSLGTPPDSDIEQTWLTEIEKRINELDSGQVQAIPWEKVRARLYRRLGGP